MLIPRNRQRDRLAITRSSDPARVGIGWASQRRTAPAPDSDVSVLGTSGRCVVKVCLGDILHKTAQEGVLLAVGESSLPAAVSTLQRRT
jgi:hypothetical protein